MKNLPMLLSLLFAPWVLAESKRDIWANFKMTEFGGKLFQLFAELPKPPTSSWVFSSNCSTAPRSLAKLSQDPNAPNLGFSLEKPTSHMKDYINLFKTTQIGKIIAQSFDNLYQANKIEIYYFSQNEKSKVPPNVAAFCECYRKPKLLYVDKFEQSGKLASTLFHEVIHTLDPETDLFLNASQLLMNRFAKQAQQVFLKAVKNAKKPFRDLQLSDFERNDLNKLWRLKTRIEEYYQTHLFRAERLAYDQQYAFEVELRGRYSNYYQKFVRPSPYSDEQIVAGYYLDPQIIQKYKEGQCKTEL